jgi:SAM-dependent methyltransferase
METLLIFHLRTARRRARVAALFEAESLLRDLDVQREVGGPLSDQKGVFWLSLPAVQLDAAIERLPRLGYSEAVDGLELLPAKTTASVKWRGDHYHVVRLYESDEKALREGAPDRRSFALQTSDGEVRDIVGYRGDGGHLSKRGLPVIDARLLVNLVYTPQSGALFLDPFAGVGGVLIEALTSGFQTLSGDIDPVLRFGLANTGAEHSVFDGTSLPYPDSSLNAIATEPPYDPEALNTIVAALAEMTRVLKPAGRIAILCVHSQAPQLRDKANTLGLYCLLDSPVDRKGLPCVVLVWEKKANNVSHPHG